MHIREGMVINIPEIYFAIFKTSTSDGFGVYGPSEVLTKKIKDVLRISH